jgi:hypothetical protein
VRHAPPDPPIAPDTLHRVRIDFPPSARTRLGVEWELQAQADQAGTVAEVAAAKDHNAGRPEGGYPLPEPWPWLVGENTRRAAR